MSEKKRPSRTTKRDKIEALIFLGLMILALILYLIRQKRKVFGMAMSQVDQKILALVKPEYMKRIPFFVRSHATKSTCQLIAREYPELYKSFESEAISETEQQAMSKIINGIFEERMKKHNL